MPSTRTRRATLANNRGVSPVMFDPNARKYASRIFVLAVGCLFYTGLTTSAAQAQKTAAQYRAEAAALEAQADRLEQAQNAPAQPVAAPLGRKVEGFVFGTWETCTTVGPKGRFGGQVLHCPSLVADGIFSETDVREIGGAAQEPQPQPQLQPVLEPPAAPPAQPPARPLGRQVQGRVFGNWETCTMIGKQLPTGGYLLRCPSLNDDNVFPEADVRL